jgi:hypothetical protein
LIFMPEIERKLNDKGFLNAIRGLAGLNYLHRT